MVNYSQVTGTNIYKISHNALFMGQYGESLEGNISINSAEKVLFFEK